MGEALAMPGMPRGAHHAALQSLAGILGTQGSDSGKSAGQAGRHAVAGEALAAPPAVLVV